MQNEKIREPEEVPCKAHFKGWGKKYQEQLTNKQTNKQMWENGTRGKRKP